MTEHEIAAERVWQHLMQEPAIAALLNADPRPWWQQEDACPRIDELTDAMIDEAPGPGDLWEPTW